MTTPDALPPYKLGASAEHSWTQAFETPPLHYKKVIHRLARLVTGYADPEWPISGGIIGDGRQKNRNTVVLALDPSNSFGAPDPERCAEIAADVAGLGWTPIDRDVPELRIIMGRRAGYDKATAHVYDLDELQTLLGAESDISLEPATVFSLRSLPDKTLWEHHEPGAMVTGPAESLPAMLQLGRDTLQDRNVTELPGGMVGDVSHAPTQVYSQ